MDGITVFTPAPGQPRFQMSVDCFSLIQGMIEQSVTDQMKLSAPVIKCKKTPRKKCSFVAERRKKR